MRITLPLVMLAALSGGCGSYFPPNRHISDRIEDAAVVGTWRMTERSLEHLERAGFKRKSPHDYRLTFNTDHKCEFASVLEWMGPPTYLKVPCTWRLEHDVEGFSNRSKANILRITFDLAGKPHGLDQNFAREEGELVLWQYHGDPDMWQFIEYTRAASK
jgi:hypothetical protein